MSVPAQEGTVSVAVTLPEGSRVSALAGSSSGTPRSSWICFSVHFALSPRQPSQWKVHFVFAPHAEPTGLPMPIAFLWTRKTDYEVLLGIAQGAKSVLLLIWGGFFSELVKSSYPPRHPQLVLFSSQSCLCGSNIKVFLPYPKNLSV